MKYLKTFAFVGPVQKTHTAIHIGYGKGFRNFKGYMDDVSIFYMYSINQISSLPYQEQILDVYMYSLRKYFKKIKIYEILKNICEKVINYQVRHVYKCMFK